MTNLRETSIIFFVAINFVFHFSYYKRVGNLFLIQNIYTHDEKRDISQDVNMISTLSTLKLCI